MPAKSSSSQVDGLIRRKLDDISVQELKPYIGMPLVQVAEAFNRSLAQMKIDLRRMDRRVRALKIKISDLKQKVKRTRNSARKEVFENAIQAIEQQIEEIGNDPANCFADLLQDKNELQDVVVQDEEDEGTSVLDNETSVQDSKLLFLQQVAEEENRMESDKHSSKLSISFLLNK